jgi:transcriptional regulator of arginine metabolism
MSSRREDRMAAIRELLEKQEVGDQGSLIERLATVYGIESNQTAISRDLHQLGATKRMIAGKTVYELPKFDASEEILRLAVLGIDHNESLIVIDTLPGLAGFVGDYLDVRGDLPVLGTLAGENVLFVTPKTTKEMKKCFEKICSILSFRSRE